MAELDLVELRGLLERANLDLPLAATDESCARCRAEGTSEWAVYGLTGGHHDMFGDEHHAKLIVAAVNALPALLSRLEQHNPVSDGWRLVPVEPTREMHVAALCAGASGISSYSDWRDIWSAMLSASPPPPGGRGRDEGDVGSVAGCAGAQSAIPRQTDNGSATPSERGPLNGEAYGAISDVTVRLGGYPVRIVVKPTSWESAVAASPLYIAMGNREQAWCFTDKASVRRLIEALQAAEALAQPPSEGVADLVASDGEARQTESLRATELKACSALSNGSDHEGDGR
jgi:hypothetical protein